MPVMIKFYIVMALAGAYAVDRLTFNGRYYLETKMVAEDLSAKFDQKIKDLVSPLHKYFPRTHR